jgi:preprotein translocase subunit SecG
MSDVIQGEGWWVASDGKWYPPHLHAEYRPATPSESPVVQGATSSDAADEPSIERSAIAVATGQCVNGHGQPSQVLPDTYPLPLTPAGLPQFLPTGVAVQADAVSPDSQTMGSTQLLSQKGRRRIPPVVAWIAAGVFFITTVAFGIIALHQTSSANSWRQADQKALAQLAVAHRSIASLNTQVSSLNGQVSSLNSQLSAQATAKEKALDQNTVLSQVVNAEGTVSTELNTCVTDLQQFLGTVSTDLGSGNYYDPVLTEESSTANADCTKAQSDNQALQSALSGATG